MANVRPAYWLAYGQRSSSWQANVGTGQTTGQGRIIMPPPAAGYAAQSLQGIKTRYETNDIDLYWAITDQHHSHQRCCQ